jgi:hypothetical protein
MDPDLDVGPVEEQVETAGVVEMEMADDDFLDVFQLLYNDAISTGWTCTSRSRRSSG